MCIGVRWICLLILHKEILAEHLVLRDTDFGFFDIFIIFNVEDAASPIYQIQNGRSMF